MADDIEEEIEFWKPVVFENIVPGRYKISDLGRIMDLKRNKLVPISFNEKGYVIISLAIVSNYRHQRTFRMHRLVAIHFISDQSSTDLEIDHIDADKTNNRASNLEWVTHEENMRRANEKGLIPYKSGCDVYNAKFKKKEIKLIRALADENLPIKIIRRICVKMGFNFTYSDFHDIVNYLSYKNVV